MQILCLGAWFSISPSRNYVGSLLLVAHNTKACVIGPSVGPDKCGIFDFWLTCALDCVICFRWRVACDLIIIDTWISTQWQVHLCTWHTKTPRPGAHFVMPLAQKLRSCINNCNHSCPGPCSLFPNIVYLCFLIFVLRSPVILADLRVSLAVTWLTVYRQLQLVTRRA